MFKLLVISFISALFVGLCFLTLVRGQRIWTINRARRKGFDSPKGGPSLYHVRDLIIRQEKDMAVQMYCEIFKVSRKEAQKAVEELERSIQKKY